VAIHSEELPREGNSIDAHFSQAARRLGLASAATVVGLGAAYAITLAIGFASLDSSSQAIGNPVFSILEILILSMMPAMVALMTAVHAWAPVRVKACTLASVVFMGAVAVVTSSVHFVILTVSRDSVFANEPWSPLLFSFEWPSVAYALDILAWDIFFAISMLFAAPAFGGTRLGIAIRTALIVSAAFALAGLSGLPLGDMRIRNIGIIGYLGAFMVVASLLAILFYRAVPAKAPG
jgi:hypothetical protein